MSEPEPREQSARTIERRTYSHKFRFGDRSVTGIVISSDHDTDQDAKYIIGQLKRLGAPGKRKVFVEQGSPHQSDLYISQIKKVVDRNPILNADFQQRIQSGRWSALDDTHLATSPYARAMDYWISQGGRVINMDCAANLSSEALAFIAANSSPQFAIESAYYSLTNVAHSFKDTIPIAIRELFPGLPDELINSETEKLYPIYSNNRKTIDRREEIRERWIALREKYMRSTLEKQMSEGDIIVAHPNHIKGLVSPDNQAT